MAGDTSILYHYLAPVRPFLERADVTELVFNRAGEFAVEQAGRWRWFAAPEMTAGWLRTLAVAAAAVTAQDVSAQTPLCSTVLPSGERCQIVLPPAAEQLSLTLRKPSPITLGLESLAAAGSFAAVERAAPDLGSDDRALLNLRDGGRWAEFLKLAVVCRRNILISGPTGSGKTTLAKGLVQLIPADERLITIEDARELIVPHRNVRAAPLYRRSGKGWTRRPRRSWRYGLAPPVIWLRR